MVTSLAILVVRRCWPRSSRSRSLIGAIDKDLLAAACAASVKAEPVNLSFRASRGALALSPPAMELPPDLQRKMPSLHGARPGGLAMAEQLLPFWSASARALGIFLPI